MATVSEKVKLFREKRSLARQQEKKRKEAERRRKEQIAKLSEQQKRDLRKQQAQTIRTEISRLKIKGREQGRSKSSRKEFRARRMSLTRQLEEAQRTGAILDLPTVTAIAKAKEQKRARELKRAPMRKATEIELKQTQKLNENRAKDITREVAKTGKITREQAKKFKELGFDERQLTKIAVEKININKKQKLFENELQRIELGGKLDSRKLFNLGLDSKSITELAERATTIKDVKEFGKIGRDLFNQSLDKTLEKLSDPTVRLDVASSKNLFKIQVNRELERLGEKQLNPDAPLSEFQEKFKTRIRPRIKSAIILKHEKVQQLQQDFIKRVKEDTNKKAIRNFFGLRLTSQERRYAETLKKVNTGQKLTEKDKEILDKGLGNLQKKNAEFGREFTKGVIIDAPRTAVIQAYNFGTLLVNWASTMGKISGGYVGTEAALFVNKLKKDGVKDLDGFIKGRYVQSSIAKIIRGISQGKNTSKDLGIAMGKQFIKDPKGTLKTVGALMAAAIVIGGIGFTMAKSSLTKSLGNRIRTKGARGMGEITGLVAIELADWYSPTRFQKLKRLKNIPKKVMSLIDDVIAGGVITTKKFQKILKKIDIGTDIGRKELYIELLLETGVDLTRKELDLLDEKTLIKAFNKITRKPKTLKLDRTSKSIKTYKKFVKNKIKKANKELLIESLVSKSGLDDVSGAAMQYRLLLNKESSQKLKRLIDIKADKNKIFKNILNKFKSQINKFDIKRQQKILKGIRTKETDITLLVGLSNLNKVAGEEYGNLLRQLSTSRVNNIAKRFIGKKQKAKRVFGIKILNQLYKTKSDIFEALRKVKSDEFRDLKIQLMLDNSGLGIESNKFYKSQLEKLSNSKINSIFKNKFKVDKRLNKKINLIRKINDLKITPIKFELGLSKTIKDLNKILKRDIKELEKIKKFKPKKLKLPKGVKIKKEPKPKSKLQKAREAKKKDLQEQLNLLGVPLSNKVIEKKNIVELTKIRDRALTNFEKVKAKELKQFYLDELTIPNLLIQKIKVKSSKIKKVFGGKRIKTTKLKQPSNKQVKVIKDALKKESKIVKASNTKFIDLNKKRIASPINRKQVQVMKNEVTNSIDNIIKARDKKKAAAKIKNLEKSIFNRITKLENNFNKATDLDLLTDLALLIRITKSFSKGITKFRNNFNSEGLKEFLKLNTKKLSNAQLKVLKDIFDEATKQKSQTKQDVLEKLENKQKLDQADLTIVKQDTALKKLLGQDVKLDELLKRPQLLKNILKNKPFPEEELIPLLFPRLNLDINDKRLKNVVATFEGTYKERINPSRNFNPKTNQVVDKTYKKTTTKNRLLKWLAEKADKNLVRSFAKPKKIKVLRKGKDIPKPSILKKFKQGKNTYGVEKIEFSFDSRTEKAEAKRLRELKKKSSKSKIAPKKKVIKKKSSTKKSSSTSKVKKKITKKKSSKSKTAPKKKITKTKTFSKKSKPKKKVTKKVVKKKSKSKK